jgi:hypothetical protein
LDLCLVFHACQIQTSQTTLVMNYSVFRFALIWQWIYLSHNRMYVSLHACMHTYIHKHTDIHTYIHAYIQTYLHTCIHVLNVYVYVYIYIWYKSSISAELLFGFLFLVLCPRTCKSWHLYGYRPWTCLRTRSVRPCLGKLPSGHIWEFGYPNSIYIEKYIESI